MDCVSCVSSFLKHLSANCSFGCASLASGSFQQAFEMLGVFLLFGFGLKVLNFSWFCKPVNLLLCDSVARSDPFSDKISAKNRMQCLKNFCAAKDKVEETESGTCDPDADKEASDGYNEEGNDNEEGKNKHYDEDKEFDVMTLRKFVKIERQRANSALLELEKERMSAAIAAEESMAMILRLQNEKSLIEMESNHYKRLAEEKLIYDQELIESLQWLVMKYESERTTLEDQLELSQTKLKKLRLFINGDTMSSSHCEGEVEASFSTCLANIEFEAAAVHQDPSFHHHLSD